MDKIEVYKKIISSISDIEIKGVSMPYTSINGNMFSFISKDGQLSLRLPEQTREKFIKKYKTNLSIQHGIVMKEYILVPDKFFKEISLLKDYFKLSYKYALTLKAKPTTKKSK